MPDDRGTWRQLADAITHSGPSYSLDADATSKVLRAIARVRDLHHPYRSVYDEGDDRSCAHCNTFAAPSGIIVPWPCDTIRALDGEQ